MKARLIHSDELGANHNGLTIHGQHLTGDWSEINPSKEVLAKLRGNRHVEIDEPTPAPAAPKASPARKAAAPKVAAKRKR